MFFFNTNNNQNKYAKGGEIDIDLEYEKYKNKIITYSNWFENGEGFSGRHKGATNKKGDLATGEYIIQNNQILWTYTDEDGKDYYSLEQPSFYIDLRAANWYGRSMELGKTAESSISDDAEYTNEQGEKYAKGGETSVKGYYTGKLLYIQGEELIIGKISGYRGTGEPVYDVHEHNRIGAKKVGDKTGELSNSEIKKRLKTPEYAKGGEIQKIKKGDLVFAKNEGSRGLVGLILTEPKKDAYGLTVVKVYFRGYNGDILESDVNDLVEIEKANKVTFAINNGDVSAYKNIAKTKNYFINPAYEKMDDDSYAKGGEVGDYEDEIFAAILKIYSDPSNKDRYGQVGISNYTESKLKKELSENSFNYLTDGKSKYGKLSTYGGRFGTYKALNPTSEFYQKAKKYAKGGEVTPVINAKVVSRAEEIHKENAGKTKEDFDAAYDKAIIEFGYNPSEFKNKMQDIGAEYGSDDDFDIYAKGGDVKSFDFNDVKLKMYEWFEAWIDNRITDEELVSRIKRKLGSKWFRFFKQDTLASDWRSIESSIKTPNNRRFIKENMEIALENKSLEIYDTKGNKYANGGEVFDTHTTEEYGELMDFGKIKDGSYFKNKYSDGVKQSSWLKPLLKYYEKTKSYLHAARNKEVPNEGLIEFLKKQKMELQSYDTEISKEIVSKEYANGGGVTHVSSDEAFIIENGDGKTVKLADGVTYKIKARYANVIFPYKHTKADILFEPVSKTNAKYKQIKSELGDDWLTDWKSMNDENRISVLKQLGKSSFAKGGSVSKTRKDYVEYLNEIGVPEMDKEENGGRVPASYYNKYGEWLQKHDQIAFNVGYSNYTMDEFANGGSVGMPLVVTYAEFITGSEGDIDLTKSREEVSLDFAKKYAANNNKRLTDKVKDYFKTSSDIYWRVRDLIERIETDDFEKVLKVFAYLYPQAHRDWKSALHMGLINKAKSREGNYADKPYIYNHPMAIALREKGINFSDDLVNEIVQKYANTYANGGGAPSLLQEKMNKHKEECLELYPNGKMALINGLYGVMFNGKLRNTMYVGERYFEIDGTVYEERKLGNPKPTNLKLKKGGGVSKYSSKELDKRFEALGWNDTTEAYYGLDYTPFMNVVEEYMAELGCSMQGLDNHFKQLDWRDTTEAYYGLDYTPFMSAIEDYCEGKYATGGSVLDEDTAIVTAVKWVKNTSGSGMYWNTDLVLVYDGDTRITILSIDDEHNHLTSIWLDAAYFKTMKNGKKFDKKQVRQAVIDLIKENKIETIKRDTVKSSILKYLKMADKYADGGEVYSLDINEDEVFDAYVAAALWSSNDDNEEPLDAKYNTSNIAPDTLQAMRNDVKQFIEKNKDAIRESQLSNSELGHSFWLTRNHHGSGFFDYALDDTIEKQLMDYSHAVKGVDLYVGDDGFIHHMGSYADGGNVPNEKYANIVFLEGSQATEALEIYDNDGVEAAIDHLAQWDYGTDSEYELRNDISAGANDKTWRKGNYILTVNTSIGYIGLERAVTKDEPSKQTEKTYADGGKVYENKNAYEAAKRQLEKLNEQGKLVRFFDVRENGKKYFEIIVKDKDEEGNYQRYESLQRGVLGTLQNAYLNEDDVLNYLYKSITKMKSFDNGGGVEKRYAVYENCEALPDDYAPKYETNSYGLAIAYAKKRSKQTHPDMPADFEKDEYSDYDLITEVYDRELGEIVADFADGEPNYIEPMPKNINKKYIITTRSGEKSIAEYWSEETGATYDVMQVVMAKYPTANQEQLKELKKAFKADSSFTNGKKVLHKYLVENKKDIIGSTNNALWLLYKLTYKIKVDGVHNKGVDFLTVI